MAFEAGELVHRGQIVTLGWRPGTVEIASPGDFPLGIVTHPASVGTQVLVEVFGEVFEGVGNGPIGWADRLDMVEKGRVSAQPAQNSKTPFAIAISATLHQGEPVKCVRGQGQ